MSDKVVENEFDRKEYNKNYYTNNKAKILNYYKEKVICPKCDKAVCKNNLLRHMSKDICPRRAAFNKLFEKK